MTYPILLDVRRRQCLVVGGGRVAERKVRGLLAAEAAVTVVSPSASPALAQLALEDAIAWHRRAYRADDLAGMLLAIAATDQPEVNRQVAADARGRGVLCNVIDQPAAGDFTLPSVVRRGDLLLTVSTSGQSPALSRHLRKNLEARFGNEYEVFLRIMGAVRRRLLASQNDSETRRELFARLVAADLPEAIRQGRRDEVQRRLSAILGAAYDASLLELIDEAPQRQGQP
ncbi:MAG TPA: bifunctional precorrin-2 dehydrogenase/sirohydrochlorin ferrochelatase [Desulfobacteraceae bacterium]|nr:bifunctional precorrin-2 dehydrogenase/sirohydrochlorin ferrochelatase [Deltaproteobacteria bacterium]MBW2355670.1 bifunctional precorrin-2 dehydrogenase/sirohydrochlorin ferrochelatase [Deltaproteobacteria bacterium]RLB98429.1 MAG: bifunctional precorrin-2 dehydrogenase/sirohydrochlorin ferrochelatase [Deltaproteobacteria bacterium]HDI58900.1 bifunctional precorrin-2 dehydrogenase/sirohydrochlorin ferrochelatase [Desulfobacteraceae bacterium]